ncbi:MAG: ATP-binding protein [Giesbergeria sp.]
MKPGESVPPTVRSAQPSRAVRWAVGVAVAIMAAISLVLMFLLTLATNNRLLYERNYKWLLTSNVVVAIALLGVLGWIGVRLAMRLRRGKFGSRLLVKLAAIFALVALVPGALIYVVSYQFVSRSIESWFDVEVEGALNAGVSLARATLEMQSSESASRTRAAAAQLAQVPSAAAGVVLERIRDQLGASDAALWSSSGALLAIVGQSRFRLDAERPSAQQLRLVRQQGVWSQIEGLDDLIDHATPQALESVHVTAMAVVPNTSVGFFSAEPRYLHVTLPLPSVLVGNAVAVQEANREYQERSLARGGLRRMYIGTLTLSLFLAVFGAVLLAVLLGNQLARPLLVLAEGVREVARGDLSPKAALQGRDELGGLTRSFAMMTQQLFDARATVQSSIQAVDTARERLQTILDNLTSGVIVLDSAGRVQSFNPGAERILRTSLTPVLGSMLADVPGLSEFANAAQSQFDSLLAQHDHAGPAHWQQAFELHASPYGAQQHATSLVARGAGMPEDARLLVFEDITDIVSAQRAQAWGEVARRLAHEIKNPLTPIQLSAERMEMKLSSKLQGADQALLAKSVKTIVEQVEAMKRLVNEFRDYARLPAADLEALDLNVLVQDVLHLYEAGDSHVPVVAVLDSSCPTIRGDAQQLRQVLHNLIQNAQDSTEQTLQSGLPGKSLGVQLTTVYSSETGRVHLTVSDEGAGFPAHILQRAFEPYVTTKVRGTGLGLAVVKKIADEHGAAITLANREIGGRICGAQVSLSFAT